MKLQETETCQNCPICNRSNIKLLEQSTEILECLDCGSEWEKSTGDITLNSKEL